MNLIILLCLVALFTAAPLNAEDFKYITASSSDFSNPHDLVLDAAVEKLYVSDMGNDVVRILAANSLREIGRIGEGELQSPHDVAFNEKGQLLVADSGNNRVVIYHVNGATARQIKVLGKGMSSPEGVTAGPDGKIYVANAGNDRIQLFQGGQLVKQVGRRGTAPGEFHRVHDIEYHKGQLYVGDPGNNRIQILDGALNPLKIFPAQRVTFNEPKYLSLDGDSNLYIADQQNNRLIVFNNQGHEIASLRQAGGKSLDRLEGVAVVGDKVWIADTYNNRILLVQRVKTN